MIKSFVVLGIVVMIVGFVYSDFCSPKNCYDVNPFCALPFFVGLIMTIVAYSISKKTNQKVKA